MNSDVRMPWFRPGRSREGSGVRPPGDRPRLVRGLLFCGARPRGGAGRSPSPTLLIGADELGVRDHMSLHRRFDLRLGGFAKIAERLVERVELEEVAVAPDGRAGAAIVRPLPVVQ